MNITDTVKYIGVNDRRTDLFEGQYPIPNGISYNSYLIIGDKIAVMDTVDAKFTDEWLSNLDAALEGKKPDFLIVQHMEPDHSSNIKSFVERYTDAKVVASAKAFTMMKNFFGLELSNRAITVGDRDVLSLGSRELTFFTAPMVHWPEVIVTYDSADKILFSADAFGKFGDLNANEPWIDEARRYYIGIVGKYGAQVQALLKKATALEISRICPLHGPVITDPAPCIELYDKWSSYTPENEGIVIAYTSVYGNTAKAAKALYEKLCAEYSHGVKIYDLARCDMSLAISDAFRYSTLVLATTTYNADIFPFMRDYIHRLAERNFSNRRVAIIENGSWAPMAAKVITQLLSECKNISYAENSVRINSALNGESTEKLEALALELSSGGLKEKEEENSGSRKYVCNICGYSFEKDGDLPEDFKCPLCGMGREHFAIES